MPSPGQILLAGGAAALAYFAFRRKPAEPSGPALCNPSPYTYDRSQVVQRADFYLDQGRRDPSSIAVDVSTDLFSPHPTGPAVNYPPIQNPQAGLPLQGVQCVFDRVTADVLARMQERGITPGADDDTQPVSFETGEVSVLGIENYPWEKPLIANNNYPTPGMFFIVGQPTKAPSGDWNINTESELVRAVLSSAMAMAGNFRPEWVKPEPPDDENGRRLRRQTAQVIRCSPYNDERYGQTNANYAGGCDASKPGASAKCKNNQVPTTTYMMQPSGRGLNWLPRHADDIGRLAQGLSAKRTTTLEGEPMGKGNSHMQLYIPAVNLERLSSNVPDEALTFTTKGLQWSDGNSTLVPPPMITRKSIDNPLGGVASWGCEGVS